MDIHFSKEQEAFISQVAGRVSDSMLERITADRKDAFALHVATCPVKDKVAKVYWAMIGAAIAGGFSGGGTAALIEYLSQG